MKMKMVDFWNKVVKDTANPFTRCYEIVYFSRPFYTIQLKEIAIDRQII